MSNLSNRQTKRLAVMHAWRAYTLMEADSIDAATLYNIVSGATEGTPPACEATADGFRLHDSRAIRGVRMHPLQAHGCYVSIAPGIDPREPKVSTRLMQPRACGTIGRKLDPDTMHDTWTGQGFAPNAADADADAKVDAVLSTGADDFGAAQAAQAALDRAALDFRGNRKHKRRGKSRTCDIVEIDNRHRHISAATFERLEALYRTASQWREALADPTEDRASARGALDRCLALIDALTT